MPRGTLECPTSSKVGVLSLAVGAASAIVFAVLVGLSGKSVIFDTQEPTSKMPDKAPRLSAWDPNSFSNPGEVNHCELGYRLIYVRIYTALQQLSVTCQALIRNARDSVF